MARRQLAIAALVLLVTGLAGVRFVHLDADFPEGMTHYGVLYTDEGWYCNAALNEQLQGTWYLEGDFNPAINVPVAPLLQTAAFSVFGISLTVARAVAALCFVVLAAAVYLLAWRVANGRTAVCSALVLLTNFVAFAYSRLALLEMPMMAAIVMSLVLATAVPGRRHGLVIVGSALLLATAILAKSSAVAAVPALAYLVARRGTTQRQRIAYALAAGGCALALVAVYNLVIWHMFPDDVALFRTINVDQRVTLSPVAMLHNFSQAVRNAPLVAPVLGFVTVVLAGVLLTRRGPFRACPLVHTALLLAAGFFALLSVSSYQPDRYFLPLVIPLALLFARALTTVTEELRGHAGSAFYMLPIVLIVGANGYDIAHYLATPRYSFQTMTADVKEIVARDTRTGDSPLLIGNFVNTVSLATAIPSINSFLGTRSLEWRLEAHRPTHYLALGSEPDIALVLQRHYTLEPIREWDVFGNYYGGRNVRLFRLAKR